MGGCCSGSKENLEPINILVLGLKGSGKSEILHVLVKQKRIDMSSTNGSKIFHHQLGKFNATFIEIGGNDDMRNIWHHYYPKAHGFIYVVDLANEAIINESYEILTEVIKHNYVQGKSILVLANKTDLCEHPDILDFYERFPLESLANSYQSHILLQCCGHSDYTELFSGMDWLRFRIQIDFQQLKNRIIFDMQAKEQEEGLPEIEEEARRPGTMEQMRSFFGRPRSAPSASTSYLNSRANSSGAIPRSRRMLRANRIHSADQQAPQRPPRKHDKKLLEIIELKEIREKREEIIEIN